MQQDTTRPVTKWQALRERWALVRSKLAAWWAGPNRWGVAFGDHPFVAMAVLAALAGLVGLAAWTLALRQGVSERVFLDHEQRLLQLEARLTAVEVISGSAPSLKHQPKAVFESVPRASGAKAVVGDAGQPQIKSWPDPPGNRWGTTDFDRAIEQFSPASVFLPGAQP